LDLAGTTDQVTGSVSDGTWSATLEGERVTRDAAEIAGKYDVLISAPDGTPALPGGNGSGTASVSPSGQVRFNFGLDDGSHAAGIGRLTAGNRWPFYAPLSDSHSALFGWIDFDPISATLHGSLVWSSVSGFTAIASMSGSR
jgi:hypothetical protein